MLVEQRLSCVCGVALCRTQAAEDFMDDDELADVGRKKLQPQADYDTFGDLALQQARQFATAEAANEHSAVPGMVPDELLAPVLRSMGKQFQVMHRNASTMYLCCSC